MALLEGTPINIFLVEVSKVLESWIQAMDKADFSMEDLKDPERLKFLLMKQLGLGKSFAIASYC